MIVEVTRRALNKALNKAVKMANRYSWSHRIKSPQNEKQVNWSGLQPGFFLSFLVLLLLQPGNLQAKIKCYYHLKQTAATLTDRWKDVGIVKRG